MLTLDMNKVNNGVVREYHEANQDGTIPWVKIAHKGDANRRYLMRKEALLKPHRRKLQLGTMPEFEAQNLLRQAFIDVILLDWGNFQPNDDGEVIKYTPKDAEHYLSMPEFYPFWDWMDNEAASFEAFRQEKLKEEVGN